nr:MAG TPA: hypothetical protein [Caudoviricetes sp.]
MTGKHLFRGVGASLSLRQLRNGKATLVNEN